MKYVKLKSLPIINFAHSYSSQEFNIVQNQKDRIFEFVVYEKGGVELKDENNNILVAPNNSFIIYPFDKKRVVSSYKYQKHYTINVFLDYEEVNKDDKDAIPLPLMVFITDERFVNQAINIIKKCCRNYFLDNENNLALTSNVIELLSIVKSYFSYQSKNQNEGINYGHVAYTNQIKEYVHNRLDKHITIDDIADELKLSRGYISEIFKTIEGISLIRYINEQKLDVIKGLVINDNLSLSEACEIVGFTDPNYVSRLFKKYYNTSLRKMKITKNI